MHQSIEKEFLCAMNWFELISSAVGSNKLHVIKACREQCPQGWALLLLYLNKDNVFHIRTKSLTNDVEPGGEPYTNAQEMLSDLMSASAATNKMIARIKATLDTIADESVRQFAARYLTKTVKIGATAETVNKAVGSSVIPVFGCMLANKYFDHPQAVVGKAVAVTEKLDGIRALAFVKYQNSGVTVSIFSRQGKQISGLLQIEQAIGKAIAPFYQNGSFNEDEGVVFDGELLITNRSGIPSKEQYKRTTKIVSADKPEQKTGITYNVFDMLLKKGFDAGEFAPFYTLRRKALETVFRGSDSPSVRVVPVEQTLILTDETSAHKAITELVEKARKDGKEGIMLNICDAPYICKRTNNLLKVKVFQDCDLEITGFQEGEGKYENTLGALIVNYKGSSVGVGSGLSDEQRKEFWEHREKYIGRIATIQYFEETNDSKGKKSIRFPVFKELREEGKEVSYS